MATTYKLQMDPTQKILLKRYLNKNGKAQAFFTKTCEKHMNKYVPFLTGNLKDGECSIKGTKIIYAAPYARKQYYTNQGMGKQGTAYGGSRGRYWDKRMMSSEGNTIVKEVANFVGGRAK